MNTRAKAASVGHCAMTAANYHQCRRELMDSLKFLPQVHVKVDDAARRSLQSEPDTHLPPNPSISTLPDNTRYAALHPRDRLRALSLRKQNRRYLTADISISIGVLGLISA